MYKELEILTVDKLESFNQEVDQFLNKFGEVRDGVITLPLENISYRPHIHAEIRNNPHFPVTYRRIHGLHYDVYSKDESIGLSHFPVDGEVRIRTNRLGPLYTATLVLRKIGHVHNFKKAPDLDPQSLLPLIMPLKGLNPYEHFITQVGNQNSGGSLYTVDCEGSRWSLHLAPDGYNFNEEFESIRKLSSKH